MTMLECGHAANATNEAGAPACAICAGDPGGGSERPVATPDLTDRMARCTCDHAPVPSSTDLAFFEFRGEGSRAATEHCLHCRYFEVAHVARECDGCGGTGSTRWHKICPRCQGRGTTGPAARTRAASGELVPCPGFEPHGAFDHDHYYCGCRGFE